MIETGSGIGFSAETPGGFLAGQMRDQHHLESDNPVEAAMARAINDTHPPAGDFVQQFVLAKGNRRVWQRLSKTTFALSDLVHLTGIWSQQAFEEANRAETGGRAGVELALAFGASGQGRHSLA